MIRVKRVYEPAGADDGTRVLVDRLWPRGVSREALRLDAWMKEAAPSDVLRRWFAHDPARWQEFRRRYFAELDGRPEVLRMLRKMARRGRVTLLFSARDPEYDNAMALKAYLEPRLRRRR